MAEELLVVLNRSENTGFGFSLLGKPGLPPIIYNILEDSPAAESGEVEVGDVILKVNETDVNRFSTKEVLKCLRLSSDPVTLKIKRDPKIKATLCKHLLSSSAAAAAAGDASDMAVFRSNSRPLLGGGATAATATAVTTTVSSHPRPEPAVHHQIIASNNHDRSSSTTNGNGSCPQKEPLLGGDHYEQQQQDDESRDRLHWEPLGGGGGGGGYYEKPKGPPKFEAYMMTGEHILNISRMPQTSLIPKQQKKVDSLRYHNSHTHHLRHQQQQQQHHNSVPNSPNEMDLGHRTTTQQHCRTGCSNSANTSPISANKRDATSSSSYATAAVTSSSSFSYHNANSFVRTSRSEDQLQMQKDASYSAVDIEIDDDITSSLNTLLDTTGREDGANSTTSDRIVWTYNAPVTVAAAAASSSSSFEQQQQQQHRICTHTLSNGSSSSSTASSSSPLRSGSPASPTSVSSSIMSSQSGSRRLPYTLTNGPQTDIHHYPHNTNGGDFSVSEAISNISSPDYRDDDDSVGIRDLVMEISDHSDSDSTLLVSEPRQQHDHRIVIQVKGPDRENVKDRGKQQQNGRGNIDMAVYQSDLMRQKQNQQDNDNEELGTRDSGGKASSPPPSEDDSDVESLHSFHYSPKAVDLPSAIRLAKRLYSLDGFKKSDVSRHLSKNNDFSRAVADEYLKYFDFEQDTLDIALRKFLKQFSLTGETQERERVLVHFSKRYLDCNPGSFNSQDAVHTLTCAIMLLNTDLHGQSINRKMTCNEFIENLAGLNEGENFPREVLKQLYYAIKNYPLEWALDEEGDDAAVGQVPIKTTEQMGLGTNPFLEMPVSTNAIEYKKGYVMRKCCYEANAKRTPFHKRSWKMFYCTLRDLVLYLHKDENGFRKNQMGDNLHNAIRIHHALATKATDYTKKQYVFRLQTADQAEYLFQTSDSKELDSWINTINLVCASFSAPPLEAAVGSQKKFQRPLLPCSHTKLNVREQLRDTEERVIRLEAELEEHRKAPPERGSKSLVIQNYKEKEAYLTFEVKRYRTYVNILRYCMSQYPDLGATLTENSIGELDEASGGGGGGGGVMYLEGGPSGGIIPPPIPDRRSPPATNRNQNE